MSSGPTSAREAAVREAGHREAVELGGGAVLAWGEAATPIEAPPAPDPSAIPGARLVAHGAAVIPGSGSIAWSCARAPVALWVDGLERAVLDGADAALKRHLDLPTLAAAASTVEPWGHARAFSGPDTRGRHLFGFDGSGAALLCTTVGEGSDRAWLEGTTASPPPTLATHLVEGLIAYPREVMGGAGAFLALTVVVVVAGRPRPRAGLVSALAARRRRP